LNNENIKLVQFAKWRDSFWDWYCDCVWTRDEGDLANPIKRAPQYRYLKELSACIENNKTVVVEKSRQMFVTHFMSAYYMWLLLFKPAIRCGIMSQNEEQVVDLLATRIVPIYQALPEGYPWPELEIKRLLVRNVLTGGLIEGHTSGANRTRGKTYSFVWLDEFGFQENQEDTLRAAIPATGGKDAKLVIVSTPAPDTLYEVIVVKERDWGVPAIERMQGFTEYRTTRGYCVASLHHTADPNRRSDEWRAEKIREIGQRAFDVEHDLKWVIPVGKAVFGDFSKRLYCDAYDRFGILNRVPLHIGVDFGGHFPAAVIMQKDPLGRCVVHRAFMLEDAEFYHFCDELKDILETEFAGMEYHLYCDPAGASKNLQGTAPPVQLLMQKYFGKPVRYLFSKPADRVRAIQILMSRVIGGEPGLILNPRLGEFVSKTGEIQEGVMIRGFESGLVYEKPRLAGGYRSLAYKKDGFYEHLFDAFGYAFIFLFPGFFKTEEENKSKPTVAARRLLRR